MKKWLCLAFLFLGVAAACEASDYLTGRVGVGVNWEGLQLKYGFAKDWMAEGKVQFASSNTVAGARVYRFLPAWSRTIFPIFPYLGTECDWVFSDYLKGGVLGGAFGGFEMMPCSYIGIGADMGLYYQNLWSGLGTMVDVGIVVNVGATFYF